MSRFKYKNLIKEIVGEDHFTADDIFVQLKKRGHNTSMSTVYRTLDSMVSDGIFTRFSYARMGLIYERNKGFHAHLIDKEKNVILDVDLDINNFDFPAGFDLAENVVNFFGSWEGETPAPGLNLLNFISSKGNKPKDKRQSTSEGDSQNTESPNNNGINEGAVTNIDNKNKGNSSKNDGDIKNENANNSQNDGKGTNVIDSLKNIRSVGGLIKDFDVF